MELRDDDEPPRWFLEWLDYLRTMHPSDREIDTMMLEDEKEDVDDQD